MAQDDEHSQQFVQATHHGWRREFLIYGATLLLMLWPLAINGLPFFAADSASYLRGGAFGFKTGLLVLDQWWAWLFSNPHAGVGADPKVIVDRAIAESGGARSIIYSLFTYVLRFPGISLLALVTVQAGAVVLVLAWLRRLVAPNSGLWSSLAAGAGVAFLTSAPWFAAYAMPDVLAGIAIAGSVALTVFYDRANAFLRLCLVLLVAFCMTTHSSHLLVAFSTLVAGGAANLWMQRSSFTQTARKVLWFASPILLAVAALLGTSYVAFGKASLAPKRYPIQLARSVSDGPGAWHLRDHCATEHYAICEVFGPNPPRRINEFLWGKDGVRYRATPEQMERIRAEESTIVRRAAMEYPGYQIRLSIRNSVSQFFEFGLQGLTFGATIKGGNDPTMVQAKPDRPQLRAFGEVIIYASFFASLLLPALLWRRLKSIEIAAVLVVVVGLLANATVCGTLSGVTDRYQGRVAWVLPALTLMILLRIWNNRRSSAKPA